MAWSARVVSATAAVVVALVASGCSRGSEPQAAPIGVVALQKGLAERLLQAGTPPTWVICGRELPAQVGGTTRCDVTFSATDSVTTLLTTTRVDGGTPVWEITKPQLSREQVAKRVSGMVPGHNVTCSSGLEARVGNWVDCELSGNGTTVNHTIEVKEVNGLALNIALLQSIPKQQVEQMLLSKVTPFYGLPPERARCDEDIQGIAGSTVKCRVYDGENTDKYVLTVTRVSPEGIDFDVAQPVEVN